MPVRVKLNGAPSLGHAGQLTLHRVKIEHIYARHGLSLRTITPASQHGHMDFNFTVTLIKATKVQPVLAVGSITSLAYR